MTLKISIEALEVIDAIARKGSFAAAAESLFHVPSALTYTCLLYTSKTTNN